MGCCAWSPLTIVATLKAVGIILSISLLIAPGAIAVLLTQRFHICAPAGDWQYRYWSQ
nr:metal ABC transporter permease [Escherichia coli]